MRQKQLCQLVIDPTTPINGFCYNYARALLDKLVEIRNSMRPGDDLSRLAHSIISTLQDQTFWPLSNSVDSENLEQFLTHVEDFLAIFEK